MNSTAEVSVIISVYNGEQYLAEAIESLLSQTSGMPEIIVIDDGSTDASAAVARQFGNALSYWHQPNAGLSAARNLGLTHASGEAYAFLDADDIWPADRLTHQLFALESDPHLDMVFGQMEQFVSPDLDDDTRQRLVCPSGSAPSCLPTSMLVRRQAFWRVGQFAVEARKAQGIDWYMRACEQGLRSTMLADVVLHRRLHRSNMGITQPDPIAYVQVVRAALQRRRVLQGGSDDG